MSSSGVLTANAPVIGGGAGAAPSVGSRSGNTTTFATTTGSLPNGNCVKFDANGNLVDSGGTCSSSFFFNVANYGSVALAFAAAAAANGGTVYFPTGTYTISAQDVPSNTTVQCANFGTTILKAGSATTNILNIPVTNDNIRITNCGFLSSGTPGTSQTAGAFINVAGGFNVKLDNLYMNGPFIGIVLNNAATEVSKVTFQNLTQRTTTAGAATIECVAAGDSHVNNVTLLGNGAAAASWPTYGLLITGGGAAAGCALTISDSAFLNVSIGVAMLPGTSAAAYLKASNLWIDTVSDYGAVLQTQAANATIGVAQFVNVHFGPVGGTGISIDQSSHGGTILQVQISNSNFGNYVDGTGFGIFTVGTIGSLVFMGNDIGNFGGRFQNGFAMTGGASNATFMGNSVFATSASFFCTGTSGSYFVEFNRWNAGAGVADSCSGGNRFVANNF
jgi:hypothetical protein